MIFGCETSRSTSTSSASISSSPGCERSQSHYHPPHSDPSESTQHSYLQLLLVDHLDRPHVPSRFLFAELDLRVVPLAQHLTQLELLRNRVQRRQASAASSLQALAQRGSSSSFGRDQPGWLPAPGRPSWLDGLPGWMDGWPPGCLPAWLPTRPPASSDDPSEQPCLARH